LKTGGFLAFTLEDAGDETESFLLNPHGRYAHTRAYVRGALETADLDMHSLSSAILRKENGTPVSGQIVIARKRR
jgi:predicted TPR repeat methyltransferase